MPSGKRTYSWYASFRPSTHWEIESSRIVVEIKRPAISLNKKHLRQLEDYAEIIKRQPQFKSEKMHFELIPSGARFPLLTPSLPVD